MSIPQLHDDAISCIFSFLSHAKSDKTSELMRAGAGCKRFHRIALEVLKKRGCSRALECDEQSRDDYERVRYYDLEGFLHVDCLVLRINKYYDLYLQLIRRSQFAQQLQVLHIQSQQPAVLTESCVQTLESFPKLHTVILEWFYSTKVQIKTVTFTEPA